MGFSARLPGVGQERDRGGEQFPQHRASSLVAHPVCRVVFGGHPAGRAPGPGATGRGKKLRVIISQTFPLTEVAAAHRAIMAGHTRGKIALIP